MTAQPLNPADATCLAPPFGDPFYCNTHLTEHAPPEDRAVVGRSTVQYTPPKRYVVMCTEHGLIYPVETPAHARNLAAKHNRELHPDEPTLNLTAAAEWLLLIRADDTLVRTASWTAALGLWEQLTGLTDEAAIRYALTVRDTPTRAAVVPF